MTISELQPISFTINSACAVSGLSRTKIYRLLSERRLRAVKVDGRTLIIAESLHALLKGKEQGQ